ncbi:MAG: hypothetical protein EA383_08060 [Spirochaetaceae bacterium]|nr:MAG: hypothetical protein EA383_08060 [Spirochaetaceae bacterium]
MFLAVLLLSLTACGLLTGVRIVAPPRVLETTISSVRFEHRIEPNGFNGFQGYELYYKIYGESSDQVSRKQADENAVSGSSDPFSTLNNRGFRRFQLEEDPQDRSRPEVIARVRNPTDEDVVFLLDFLPAINRTGNPNLQIQRDTSPEEYRLIRTITADSDDFGRSSSRRRFDSTIDPRYFEADGVTPHADVDSEYDGDTSVSIVIFAIGQAFDVNTLSPVRSIEAVRLVEFRL